MFANTKKQCLYQHSVAIAYASLAILKKISSQLDQESDNLYKINKNVLFFAALFHDLGKIDNHFQNFVNKPKKMDEENGSHIDPNIIHTINNEKITFNEYIRHNELSYVLFNAIFDPEKLIELFSNTANFDNTSYLIYWHHAKIIREKKLKNLVYICF